MRNDLDAPFERIRVTPVSPAIGAVVEGVRLAGPLHDEDIAEIRRALLKHLVVFFHDQPMSRVQHLALGRRFGELAVDLFVQGPEDAPEIMRIVKHPSDERNFGGRWHSDVTFLESPALGSILRGLEVPAVGGDTQFANMYAAYEALSPGMQRMLQGLRAINRAHPAYNRETMDTANAREGAMRYTEADPRGYESVHPVVRTHPETGRKALFVNLAYTVGIEDMSEADSRPLLDFLFSHLARPEFACRFRWRKDSVAFWDNRCSQHFPVNDYSGERRVMERVTVVGDRPF